MKKTLYILFFLSTTYTAFGQNYSIQVDSITNHYLSTLRSEEQKQFSFIMGHRASLAYFKHVDSIACDYTFVEEVFNAVDTSVHACLRYFNENDSTLDYVSDSHHQYVNIPFYSTYDGLEYELNYTYFSHAVAGTFFSNVYEYYYTLDTLLKNCSQLKPIQNIMYDSTITILNQSDTSDTNATILANQFKNELRSTYKIITFIDHQRKKVLVSIQLPETDPQIAVSFLQSTFYDW